jgi:hypothetical protein
MHSSPYPITQPRCAVLPPPPRPPLLLQPHAIITAVGTKVFLWDVATEKWTPDPGYAMLLNDGWDADQVGGGVDG